MVVVTGQAGLVAPSQPLLRNSRVRRPGDAGPCLGSAQMGALRACNSRRSY